MAPKTAVLFLQLIVFFIRASRSARNENLRSSSIAFTRNKRLLGYTIAIQRTPSVLSCAQRCLTSRECASFNYKCNSGMESEGMDSGGTCELNHCEAVYQKAQGIEQRGWLYGYLQGKFWERPTEFNFTFTTLGATGAFGPTNTSQYQGTSLDGDVQLDRGTQIWTVPTRGTYTIEALGASGADGTNTTGASTKRSGGLGARIKGTFYFLENTILRILVGQVGIPVQHGEPLPGGGGGGSFVTYTDGTPLIIAGGGGGGSAPWQGWHDGNAGQLSGDGSLEGGGTGGHGGRIYDIYEKSYDIPLPVGAGAGLKTNGASGVNATGGSAYVNGGEGGLGTTGSEGGFGGGGAAFLYAGGGGGYSGGGVTRATRYSKSGGGGSYNAGSGQEGEVRGQKGEGRVVIILIRPDIG
ncbi:WAG22 antigen [Nematostella vectensis]|uniref:WAG22 antigen n=1 Tax=Nematostella vectensis TaxID=45351 RepID=UPI002077609D|nr:WAG22 antigen [Nematostella vectensis]XP_048582596.1 WAG22 antigen [Nematostella vectensis]XP_048582597.1 WAG22 antigen [Nematostella vectensis]